MTALDRAYREYLDRQSRASHPAGRFDNAGRWYPDPDTEECPCCASVRSPSRAWPCSLNKHCRSMEHVASLYRVDVAALRRLHKKVRSLEIA